MSDTINPITGLPVNATPTPSGKAPAPEINPITGKVVSIRPQGTGLGDRVGRVTNTFDGMSYKDYKSFQRYGVNVTEGIDHHEARAQNQSTLEKWTHGLAKAQVTASGALVENTVGLLWGLGSVATGGSFYDHALGRGIDSMNETMAEWMPNYYTRAEENADVFSATNLLSANFWADKVANGAGYVLGSIATDVALAYVSGGQSLSLTAARYAAKFGKIKKTLDVAQKAKAINNVYRTTKAASKGKQIGGLLTKTGQVTKTGGWKSAYARAENGLISAIGESNVEARQAKHETLDALKESWLEDNPGKTEADIPQDVLQDFNDRATAAGNTVFAINMPVVAGTNMITIGKMLGPGYRKAVSKLAKGGDNALYGIRKSLDPKNAGKWVDAGLDGNWAKRTLTNVQRRAGEQIKSSVSEAFQEGTQFFGSQFAQEYYGEKYSSNQGIGGMISAMEHGLRNTFGTKEGVESMLIGGIVGGGTVGVTNTVRRLRGKKTTHGQKAANTQKALDLLNDGALNKPIENIRNATESIKLVEAMDNALALSQDTSKPIDVRRKAHKKFKDAQYALISQNAQYFASMGKMDLVMEQLDDAKDLTEEEFKKAFGYDVNAPLPEGGQAAIIDKLKDRFKKHQQTLDRIDSIAPVKERTTGLPRKLMSEEEIEQENLEIEAANFYRHALYRRAASIDGHTERLDNLRSEMQGLADGKMNESAMEEYEYSPNIEFIFEDKDGVVIDGKAVENGQVLGGKVLEELNRVAEGIKNPLNKKEFLESAQDYLHLLAERQAIINSYEALTGPEGPATAEFLKARQDAMEGYAEQIKLQKEVDNTINNAVVPEDLRNLPANATQEQIDRAEKKRKELVEEIAKEAVQKYNGLTLSELEAELAKKQEADVTDARELAVLNHAINSVRAKEKKAAENKKDPSEQSPEEMFNGTSDQSPGAEEAQADKQERDKDLLDADNNPEFDADELADETQPAEEGLDDEIRVDEETGEILEDEKTKKRSDTGFSIPEVTSKKNRLAQLEETLSDADKTTLSLLREKGHSAEKIEEFIIRNASKTVEGNNLLADFEMEDILNNPQEYSEALVVNAMRRRMFGDSPISSGNAENRTKLQLEEIKEDIKTGEPFQVNFTTDKSMSKKRTTDGRSVSFNYSGKYSTGDIGTKRLAYEALIDLGILKSETGVESASEIEKIPTPTGTLDIGIVDIQDFAEVVTEQPNGQKKRQIKVDEQGRPILTDNAYKAKYNIDGKEVLKTPIEGETVTFELAEDTGSWESSAILVKRGDATVGILKPALDTGSQNRQVIYQALKAGNTVTATSKFSGRFHTANTVQENGNRGFFRVTTTFDNPALGVVQMPGMIPQLVVGEGQLGTLEMDSRTFELGARDLEEMGQVYILYKSPITGGMEPFKAHTRLLTEEEVNKAMELIQAGDLKTLNNLVGLNSLPFISLDRLENDKKLQQSFAFTINPGGNGEAIVFWSPSAKSLVKVYTNQFTGDISSITDVARVVPPTGGGDPQAVDDRFTPNGTGAKHKTTGIQLLQELRGVIENKRYQVLSGLINDPNATFEDPMTGETVNYREHILEGDIPKVYTDASPYVGPLHNVGLEFSELNIEGIEKADQPMETKVPTAPEPKPEPRPTAEVPIPKSKGSNPRGGKKLRRRGSKPGQSIAPQAKPQTQTELAAQTAQVQLIINSLPTNIASNFGEGYKEANTNKGVNNYKQKSINAHNKKAKAGKINPTGSTTIRIQEKGGAITVQSLSTIDKNANEFPAKRGNGGIMASVYVSADSLQGLTEQETEQVLAAAEKKSQQNLEYILEGLEDTSGMSGMQIQNALRSMKADIEAKMAPITTSTASTITYTPKGKKTQTYTVEGTKILNSKGKEVFKKDSADRRKIFANLAVQQGRADVVEHKGVKYVVNIKGDIMSTKTGKIMEWGKEHSSRKAILAESTVYEATQLELFENKGEEQKTKCGN